MTQTSGFDLLTPWLTFAVALFALLYVQRWIHRHLFGVGYLLSQEKHAATLAYYLFLMPGVILHEFSHYIVAYFLGYNAKKFNFFPESQEDGSLEMGFVQLDEIKNPVFAALVGIAPLISGIVAVLFISNRILDLPTFITKLGTLDIIVMGDAIGQLFSKPDFFLWSYVLFGVANAMMPSREDRRGWWMIGAAFVLFVAVMLLIGESTIVYNLLSGPVTDILHSLSTVFGLVLFFDCICAVVILIVEMVLERITGHKVEYHPALPAPAAGALGAGRVLNSVYDLNLPLPASPGKEPAVKKPGTPALAKSTTGANPALPAASAARPAAPGGAKPGEPAKPAGPISGPPALRTATPASNLPAKPGTATPAKSPAGSAAKPAEPPRFRPNVDKDDYIDADVVEEDVDEDEDDDDTDDDSEE